MSEEKKFDPGKRKKLNNPVRLEWLPPARIWEMVAVADGGIFADIGAGTGYLTGHIAALAGPRVTVHALDIEPLMVAEMNDFPPPGGSIRPQLMERDRLPFSDGALDGVWMITLYHELDPAEPLLREIHRVLRPEGRLLIVDWEKSGEASQQGPPLEHRVEAETVQDTLVHNGFAGAEQIPGFLFHFAVLARR